LVKDDRAFADIVAERAGGILNQANKKLAGFMPTGELTPQKFRKSRDDLGEIARLQMKYGTKPVEDWGRKNSLKQDGL